MRYPFQQKYGISRVHKEGAVDYLTPYGSAIYAPFDGEFRYYKDNLGSIYVSFFQKDEVVFGGVGKLPAGTRWDFVHVKSVNAPTSGAHVPVTAGTIMGYSGNSGNVLPKPTKENPLAGSHTHLGIRPDWRRKPKVHANVKGVMEALWQATQNPAQAPKPNKLEIDLQNALKAKDGVIADLKLRIEAKEGELKNAMETVAEKQHELDSLKAFGQTNLGLDFGELAGDILEETGAVNGLLGRWASFVDTRIPESWKIVRSILKYDIFVALGAGAAYVVATPLVLQQYGFSSEAAAAVAGVLGVAFKLLVTRYDTNKDGKLDEGDFQALRLEA